MQFPIYKNTHGVCTYWRVRLCLSMMERRSENIHAWVVSLHPRRVDSRPKHTWGWVRLDLLSHPLVSDVRNSQNPRIFCIFWLRGCFHTRSSAAMEAQRLGFIHVGPVVAHWWRLLTQWTLPQTRLAEAEIIVGVGTEKNWLSLPSVSHGFFFVVVSLWYWL